MERPYLKALLEYPCVVRVKWDVDEQQADSVQHTWEWKKAKEELIDLISSLAREQERVNELSLCCQDLKEEIKRLNKFRKFTNHDPACAYLQGYWCDCGLKELLEKKKLE